MNFHATRLPGVFLVEAEVFEDERGHFANVYLERELESHGLDCGFVQCSVSHNRRKGTLRGLHFQAAPHGQRKLVRCSRGAAYDVVVDLRPGSDTYGKWLGLELDSSSLRSVYVPEDLAHGFVTLCDDTEITYLLSGGREPAAERGVRWDDPAIGIAWPLAPSVISVRDRGFPLLGSEE